MYYVAKALEMLGMTSLMVALFVGLTDERGMATEYLLLAIGIVLFFLGRFLEKQGRQPPE